ncbi:hypothetical protein JCM19037_1631 [Geomicrobium sp. JCM 19037]|uniref:hypothetical protein n=1 Tax=Geomicrobium sp. JCM 19037 TaxID=1460634 RepID=UPI00045F46D4|nr:hypothetical protein [Geomicrobium sp. JCM 19037]GAK03316.1 hypothetical protein JCM19037_1631 [Geomicrobium sp. JCM 19037]
MVNIPITERYYLRSDAHQFIIAIRTDIDNTAKENWTELQAKGKPPHETVYTPHKYPGSIDHALRIIVQLLLRESDAESWEELRGDVARIERKMDAIHDALTPSNMNSRVTTK